MVFLFVFSLLVEATIYRKYIKGDRAVVIVEKEVVVVFLILVLFFLLLLLLFFFLSFSFFLSLS